MFLFALKDLKFSLIESLGFITILLYFLVILSKERAGQFYQVHRERPFYGELVEYMSSGPIIAAILEKDNAVVDFSELIGATDPLEANEGTIRHEFAESKGKNAVHGSDSNENANIEADFHFSLDERF